MPTLLSDSNQPWQPAPDWVTSLIQLGYRWNMEKISSRRIALVSMPCDSAAAGLIVLGAIIRDLGDPGANLVDGYYDRLLRYAQEFLTAEKYNGEKQSRLTGKLRSVSTPRRTVQISPKTLVKEKKLALEHPNGMIEWPNPSFATHWYIDGELPPKLDAAEGELSEDRYRSLIYNAHFFPENFRKAYSGLCFAGRSGGERASWEACSKIRFKSDNEEFGLHEALTINGWSELSLSRVSFFNTRTKEFDQYSSAPSLTVADGDIAFLTALGMPEFHHSDIVGVINRAVDRDSLEAVGAKMLGLRQWYEVGNALLGSLPPVPQGISLAILKRR